MVKKFRSIRFRGGLRHPHYRGLSRVSFPKTLTTLLQYAIGEKTSYTEIGGVDCLTPEEPHGSVRAPREGRCALFDGTDDYGAFTTVDLTGEITASCWAKRTTVLSYDFLFAMPGKNNKIGFNVGTTEMFIRAINGGVSDALLHGVDSTEWNFIAFTRDENDKCDIFVNGTKTRLFDDVAQSGTVSFSLLGSDSVAEGNYFGGSVRDARVYNTAKTETEIAAIMACDGSNHDREGLVGGWMCNSETGLVEYDWSDNGNHITWTNINQATFHATDAEITSNPANQVGYSLDENDAIVPAVTATTDALGNSLTYTGKTPLPIVTETPCVTGDGSAVYVDCGVLQLPATGGFEIDFDYYHSNAAVTQRVIDIRYDGASSLVVLSNHNGVINNQVNGMTLFSGSYRCKFAEGTLIENEWHRCNISRVGNTFTFTIINSAGTHTSSETFTKDFGTNTIKSAFLGGYWDTGAGSYSISNPCYGRLSNFKYTTASLEREYTFQEGEGRTVHDISGNGNHGTIVGGNLTNVWANKVVGQDHCVLNGGRLLGTFDGADDYISFPAITFEATDPITLCGRFRYTSTAIMTTFGRSVTDFPYCRLYLGKVDINNTQSTIFVNDGLWHSIIWTRDSSGYWKAYVDGVLAVSNSTPALGVLSIDMFGAQWLAVPANSRYYNGSAYDIRMYSAIKTLEQIQNIANEGIDTDDLLLHIPLTHDALDESGNDNHGTLVGATDVEFWSFIPGVSSTLCADGSPLTLPVGSVSPKSLTDRNPFDAAELNGLGCDTLFTADDDERLIVPYNTKFSKSVNKGKSKFITVASELTDGELAEMLAKVGQLPLTSDFDGVDDCVEVYDGVLPASLQTIGDTITIFARTIPTIVNVGIAGAWAPEVAIIELRQQGATNTKVPFSFGFTNSTLHLGVTDDYTTGSEIAYSTIIRDPIFHDVAVVIDGNSVKFYVDGELDGSHTLIRANGDRSIGSNPAWLNVGVTKTSAGVLDKFYKGGLELVSVYNTAKTVEEIVALGNDVADADGLLMKYVFNGNARDSSGNAHHGVLNNPNASQFYKVSE